MLDIERRFKAKTTLNFNGCWEWTGSVRKDGYGRFRINGKTFLAHRVAYYIHNGHWPVTNVCHSCDNPSCVNPEHLFPGSQKDNMQDCLIKNRNFFKAKTHCKRGHPLHGDNVYRNPAGARVCKLCRNYRLKKYRRINAD